MAKDLYLKARVDAEIKQTFEAKCAAMGLVPSQVMRDLADNFVAVFHGGHSVTANYYPCVDPNTFAVTAELIGPAITHNVAFDIPEIPGWELRAVSPSWALMRPEGKDLGFVSCNAWQGRATRTPGVKAVSLDRIAHDLSVVFHQISLQLKQS